MEVSPEGFYDHRVLVQKQLSPDLVFVHGNGEGTVADEGAAAA